MDSFELFDCLTGSIETIPRKGIKQKCRELGIDYTLLYKMGTKVHVLASRYVLVSAIDKVFTLVELDTGIEYACCAPNTLFLHLREPYHANQAKYVYELISQRQRYASICGRVFFLKGASPKANRTKQMAAHSVRISEDLSRMKQVEKIRRPLLTRVGRAIKAQGARKNQRTSELLGCTTEFFATYIKSRFTKGMTFENYGEWHVDHIIQCDKFDLRDEAQQKKCFHYTNLQPLWATSAKAKEYGESDLYIGNMNKSSRGASIDYRLKELIMMGLPGQFTESQATDFSAALIRSGARIVGHGPSY